MNIRTEILALMSKFGYSLDLWRVLKVQEDRVFITDRTKVIILPREKNNR